MNRLAIAPEASPNRGSSFEMMKNRVGSVPVHGSRYFRSIAGGTAEMGLS